MEKGQPYFDPYNFNMQNIPNNMQAMPGMTPGSMPEMDMMTSNPAMYYEQQYMYYKYLTQMLEYKMKMKEWEKLNKDAK
ncbi:MAG: hypothetical protein RR290_01190 [Clostridia bacterium]